MDNPSLYKKITIYTDGACSGNPGPGGYGALILFKDIKKEIFGGYISTTNNQMEMIAAIKALESLKEKCNITLYTDSVYLKNGINIWIHNWRKNNWLTSAKKPVKNKELWLRLSSLIEKHDINWQWVKGHAGIEGNEIADSLACRGKEQAMNSPEKSAKIFAK
ncbi:MAG TPA: ribonuclease HI [Candidatus Megaira endosymbiont of Hartmannula sinica]|nr:ribonuclease HI [Candidatus Megaera endosymbiont of Hartmannula sinica]